jgi:hypothetical protein
MEKSFSVPAALTLPALALAVFTSCAEGPATLPEAPAPTWIQDGNHPIYPKAAYLTAVGVSDRGDSPAKTREEADQRARRELVLSLQAKVRAKVQVETKTQGRVRDGGVPSSLLDVNVNEFTEVLGEGTLEGAKIVDHYEDPRTGAIYALAALDRELGARGLCRKIEESMAEADRAMTQADGARSDGASRPQIEIQSLLAAFREHLKAALARETHGIIAGREIPGPLAGSLGKRSDLKSRLERLLGELQIEVVEGQGQQGALGEALPRAVILRSSLKGGLPVPGMSLRLRPESPSAVELSADRLVTGEDGKATLTLPLVKATGKEVNRIEVTLDLGEAGDLPAPTAFVEYHLPTRETLKVLVLLEEIQLGRSVDPSPLGQSLMAAVQKAGFPVVDPGAVLREGEERKLLQGDHPQVKEVLAGKVAVLLRGKAEATAGGTLLGLPSTRASAALEGLDVQSGRAIVSLSLGPTVEAHQKPQEAARRSLKLLEKDLCRGVLERLEKLVGSPSSTKAPKS